MVAHKVQALAGVLTLPPTPPSPLMFLIPPAERELMLIKLRAPAGPARTEVLQLAEIFRARVVDVSERGLTLCVSGDPGKVCVAEWARVRWNAAFRMHQYHWYLLGTAQLPLSCRCALPGLPHWRPCCLVPCVA